MKKLVLIAAAAAALAASAITPASAGFKGCCGGWNPGGGFHHLALGVESEEALEQAIARLHANGVPTSPIVDHGMFKSCYFMDPEGRNLEMTVQLRKLGISEDFSPSEELAIAVQARNAAPEAPVLTTTN